MPVIDWTRTDLKHKMPNGAIALRFDQDRFAAFDLFILKRESAEDDYTALEIKRAQTAYQAMSPAEIENLTETIIAGLPGKMTEGYSLENFRRALECYSGMTHSDLRANLMAFLAKVLPHAEQAGVKLAIHPDDPPWDMFGLPRIICTPSDLDILFGGLPSPSNGMTLCLSLIHI